MEHGILRNLGISGFHTLASMYLAVFKPRWQHVLNVKSFYT